MHHLHDLGLEHARLVPGGLRHQAGRLADLRVEARLLDLAMGFPLLHNAPAEQQLSCAWGLLRSVGARDLARQRLPGEGGGVHQHLVPLQKLAVCRHDVPPTQEDHVPRDKLRHGDDDHLPIALHRHGGGHLGLQGVQGLPGLELLVEADEGIHKQHQRDDHEVGPVLSNGGEKRRDDEHEGHHAHELLAQHDVPGLHMLGDLVAPVLQQPLRRLRGAQPGQGGVLRAAWGAGGHRVHCRVQKGPGQAAGCQVRGRGRRLLHQDLDSLGLRGPAIAAGEGRVPGALRVRFLRQQRQLLGARGRGRGRRVVLPDFGHGGV
mmetsp:Transcript_134826/g.319602  ORF Transcript_134826/g.319602 Transcript_134826/m.319602 type:complete len:319 (-) Transcript_134826:6-962(-)